VGFYEEGLQTKDWEEGIRNRRGLEKWQIGFTNMKYLLGKDWIDIWFDEFKDENLAITNYDILIKAALKEGYEKGYARGYEEGAKDNI